jgi:metabolite-proton symporter
MHSTVTYPPADRPSATEFHDPTPIKRVAIASFAGSAIEYYDFFIYGTAAALVFPSVFFPNLGTTMATIASMGTFAAAFFARPLGAAVFGHFGDRLGRKKTLVATLLIMGLSTVAVGLVPTTATIGIGAPLILLMLRLLQGFAVGGEWAGSALLTAEYAPTAKRGKYGMFTHLGTTTGLVAANLIFLGVHLAIGERSPAFMEWGWRIPFLLSTVLVGVALYVRLNINETPVFTEDRGRTTVSRMPISDLFRAQRRQVILAAGCVIILFTFSFMATTYLTNYAVTQLGHPMSLVLFVGAISGLCAIGFSAVSASLSDTLGRRRIIVCAFAVAIPWSLAVMPLINTRDPRLFGLAIFGTYAINGIAAGPLASFIPEIFATRWRYTGTALSFNIGGIIGGAVPPMIAASLVASYGSWAVGVMMAVLGLISFVCTFLLPETVGRTLTEHAGPGVGATTVSRYPYNGFEGERVALGAQPGDKNARSAAA